jgi:hypothetical protein
MGAVRLPLESHVLLSTTDGNYGVPPATVIETFWGYKRNVCSICNGLTEALKARGNETCSTCQGKGYVVVVNDDDMVLLYKLVNPATFDIIPFEDGDVAKKVTFQMICQWVSTQNHPHFIGGHECAVHNVGISSRWTG